MSLSMAKYNLSELAAQSLLHKIMQTGMSPRKRSPVSAGENVGANAEQQLLRQMLT